MPSPSRALAAAPDGSAPEASAPEASASDAALAEAAAQAAMDATDVADVSAAAAPSAADAEMPAAASAAAATSDAAAPASAKAEPDEAAGAPAVASASEDPAAAASGDAPAVKPDPSAADATAAADATIPEAKPSAKRDRGGGDSDSEESDRTRDVRSQGIPGPPPHASEWERAAAALQADPSDVHAAAALAQHAGRLPIAEARPLYELVRRLLPPLTLRSSRFFPRGWSDFPGIPPQSLRMRSYCHRCTAPCCTSKNPHRNIRRPAWSLSRHVHRCSRRFRRRAGCGRNTRRRRGPRSPGTTTRSGRSSRGASRPAGRAPPPPQRTPPCHPCVLVSAFALCEMSPFPLLLANSCNVRSDALCERLRPRNRTTVRGGVPPVPEIRRLSAQHRHARGVPGAEAGALRFCPLLPRFRFRCFAIEPPSRLTRNLSRCVFEHRLFYQPAGVRVRPGESRRGLLFREPVEGISGVPQGGAGAYFLPPSELALPRRANAASVELGASGLQGRGSGRWEGERRTHAEVP